MEIINFLSSFWQAITLKKWLHLLFNMGLESAIRSTKNFLKENKGFCIGATLMITAGIIDSYITSQLIKDVNEELMPYGRFFLSKFGPIGLYYGKAIACALIASFSKISKKNYPMYIASGVWTLASTVTCYSHLP